MNEAAEQIARGNEPLDDETEGTLLERQPDGEFVASDAGEDLGKGQEARTRAARAAQEREEQEQEAQGQSSSGASESKTGEGSGLNKRLDTLISWLDSRLRSL